MADTCAACQAETPAAARWCGSCGANLRPVRRQPGRPAADQRLDPALVGAASPVLLLDEEGADEVAPAAPTWSPRARAAAAIGVLVVLAAALVLRPEPKVVYEPRGFTARGDAIRSGVVSLAPLRPPTDVAWTAEVGAARTSWQVRAGGDVVIEQTSGGVLALREAASGQVRWLRRDLPAPGAVRAGDVVVAVQDGLRAFAVEDGRERWRTDAPGEASLQPLGDDLLVRAGDDLGVVSTTDGRVRWRLFDAPPFIGSIHHVAPGGAGIGVWFTAPPGLPADSPRVTHHVALLDPADGTARFVRPLDVLELPRSPIAVGARSVAIIDGAEVRLLTPGGAEQRTIGLGGDHPVALAASGELLAVATAGGGLRGVDLRLGTGRWSRPDLAPDALLVTDGLVVTSDGTIVDGETGRDLSTQRRLQLKSVLGETSLTAFPAVAGDTLELRDRRGDTVTTVPLLPDEAAAPAVGAGRVFAPTREGVVALAVADGTRDWAFAQLPTDASPTGGQPTARTPAVAEATVLVTPGSTSGGGPGIVALERSGGVRTWDRERDVPLVRGPLTLAGEVAFVPVGDEVHAYDVLTGRRAFAAVARARLGPLVLSPNRVIGGPADDGGEAVAILRRDRSESWRAPLDPCSGPAVAGQRIVWGTATGVTALEELDGAPAWQVELPRPVCLDPVVAGGRVIVVVDPSTLRAVAASDGTDLWAVELPAPAVASPVAAGEHVLVPLLDGTLRAYVAATGVAAWSYDLGGIADAPATVLDERLLVHLRDGRLVALRP